MLDKLKALIPDTGRKWIAYVVVVLTIWAVNKWLGTDFPTPPVPAFGWVRDDVAVEQVSQTLRFKVFADTPAGQDNKPLPPAVYLWEAYRKIDPNGPPSKNQGQVGSCVSFGTNNAILRTMACDIVINGRAFELKDIAEEVTYAGARVQIGGGRIRGDGAVGAWAAKFVLPENGGIVSREKHGAYDLTTYSESRARSWGNSGVPADLMPVAKEHPVAEITQVKSWEEAKKALSQGYGIAVCSDQGFSMQRDARGVAAPRGTWAHCMCLDGYHTDGGREYGHIENSWGPKAHTGPVGWGNPPPSGFWADSATIDRMLKQGDSWAFSGVKGFPARDSEWFVSLNTPARIASLERKSASCSALQLLCP
jgi:hypothetical protein